jgi:hypothetical protein
MAGSSPAMTSEYNAALGRTFGHLAVAVATDGATR